MRSRITRALLGELEIKTVTVKCEEDLEGVLSLPTLPSKVKVKGGASSDLIERLLERAVEERKKEIIREVLSTATFPAILKKFWKLSPARVLENPSCPEELKKEICLSGKNSPRLLRQKFKLATLGWEIRPKRLNAIAKRIRELVGPVKTIAGDPRGLYMFEEDLERGTVLVSEVCIHLYRALLERGERAVVRVPSLFYPPSWVFEFVLSNRGISKELSDSGLDFRLRGAVLQRLHLASALVGVGLMGDRPYYAHLSLERLKELIEGRLPVLQK